MHTQARHLLVEYRGCELSKLQDLDFIQALLERAARAAGATVVQSVFHRYSPQGVTGVVVLEESHLSIHTWPESGYAAADLYTCGACTPDAAHEVLKEALQAQSWELMHVQRGLDGPRGMQVQDHQRGSEPS